MILALFYIKIPPFTVRLLTSKSVSSKLSKYPLLTGSESNYGSINPIKRALLLRFMSPVLSSPLHWICYVPIDILPVIYISVASIFILSGVGNPQITELA